MDIHEILKSQREFFHTGATLSVDFRIRMLKKLHQAISANENEICRALASDLGKSDYESYMCEVGLALSELSFMIRHTRSFAKEKTVPTPLSQFASRSYRKPSPYGNVLIMSPWNYPFLLSIDPLANAISAGNTAILKPSAYSPATSDIIARIIGQVFPAEHAVVITGGRAENRTLLEQKLDMIFFTGSQNVGKEVLRHAAENLTPAVLELGGKSPCIVDSSAKIKLAAKRIVFGKYLNCGQTCVAPDYILCRDSIKDAFVAELARQIRLQFGSDPLRSGDYGKIINEKHFDRILGLIDPAKIVCGGQYDRSSLKIEPTVMENVTWDDPVMQEEIFGPVLPVLTYGNIDQVYDLLADKPKPLALYIFAQDKRLVKDVTSRLSYGGGCVNDVIIHLATSHLPFGGVGESGMGAYHGKAGFDVFSHTKSIVDKKTWIDLPMRYQPYDKGTGRKLIRFFLK